MRYIDIHESIKYLKNWHGRATDPLNIMNRAGRIDRDAAVKIINKIDGQVSEQNAEEFCESSGITLVRYEEIISREDSDSRLPRAERT